MDWCGVVGARMVANCYGLQLVERGRWHSSLLVGGLQPICWEWGAQLCCWVLSPSVLFVVLVGVEALCAWGAGNLGGEGLVGEGLCIVLHRIVVGVRLGYLRKVGVLGVVGAWGADCGGWDR